MADKSRGSNNGQQNGNAEEKLETLKITQAQERLGISRATLWRLIRKYQIPVTKDILDGRTKRVRVADVERVRDEAERVRAGVFS